MSWFSEAFGLSETPTEKVDTSRYMGWGSEFLDPNSTRNRGMYNSLKQMGIDSVAQQYLSGAKMQAMGQNPFAQDQYRAGLSNSLGQTQNAYNSYLNNAYNTGSGLLGYGLQGDMANANATNASRMQAAQNRAGLFASIIQAAPKYLFPGAGTTTSTAGSGAGTPWAGGGMNDLASLGWFV